jgi:hypothetical protein
LYFLVKPKSSVPEAHEEIAIEILPTEVKASGGGAKAHGPNRIHGGQPLPSFESLKLSDVALSPGAGGKSATAGGDGWREDDWGSGGGDLHHVESTSELQLLAGELDGAMFYPVPLLKRDISGAISARLYFLKTGGCDWSKTKILPGEPHLRVYVLGMLKKVCGLGQIQSLHLRTSEFADLSFNFHFIDQGDINENPAPWITGNVIALERQRRHFPLKIPLGPIVLFGGDIIHVDFGWLADQWDRLVGEKKDPMAAFQ